MAYLMVLSRIAVITYKLQEVFSELVAIYFGDIGGIVRYIIWHDFASLKRVRAIIFCFALGASLVAPLSSYGQAPTSQDSPVVEISQNDWRYRWGDSPVDDQGMPLWIYEDTASPEWKPVQDSSDFRKNPQKQHILWMMIQLPKGRWKHPMVMLPPVYQNLEVYRNHQRIYKFGEFRPANRNKYSNYTLEQKVEERTQELKAAQGQMVMQSKMASLGDLVAGVAHEMNNPIGVIHSAADTANRGVHKVKSLLNMNQAPNKSSQNSGQLQQSLELLEANNEVITTASDRIARIVQSLRAFATLDEALFQRVDLRENIDTTLTLIQHELMERITVIKEYGEIPLIQCYPNELNQAFMNLLRNAVQAIEGQGTITIATYVDEAQVYIKISDTGKGIPPADLSKIYDPGFTTQSGGIGKGLGLSIVYNIVQKHHGNIQVSSEIGRGTDVTIALPMEQENAWSP